MPIKLSFIVAVLIMIALRPWNWKLPTLYHAVTGKDYPSPYNEILRYGAPIMAWIIVGYFIFKYF